MRTKLSSKGQVVLPSAVRNRLGLQPGDDLLVELDGHRILLTPRRRRSGRVRIVKDPVTGLPVLTCGGRGAVLRSEQVAEILTEFP